MELKIGAVNEKTYPKYYALGNLFLKSRMQEVVAERQRLIEQDWHLFDDPRGFEDALGTSQTNERIRSDSPLAAVLGFVIIPNIENLDQCTHYAIHFESAAEDKEFFNKYFKQEKK